MVYMLNFERFWHAITAERFILPIISDRAIINNICKERAQIINMQQVGQMIKQKYSFHQLSH